MKIAIAGKGGSGKTTIAGILARLLSRRGHTVWAIDADSNPNLGVTMGVPLETVRKIKPLEGGILKEAKDGKGERTMQLALAPDEVARKFGHRLSDQLTLILMGTVDHAGEG